MEYKILYIEDLKPDSYIAELESNGFQVTHIDPSKFEDVIKAISGYDILLLDFRLTSKTAYFDAPTIAQTLRTKNSTKHLDIPIVLLSNEKQISDYYKDLTSQDLFDLSISKEVFLQNSAKYCKKFISIITAYQIIKNSNFNIVSILSTSDEKLKNIDYRLKEKLKNEIYNNDIFAYSSFILNNLIKSAGILIGTDFISARLGVSKHSSDWHKLLDCFQDFKYKGIFSDSYDRWWSDDLVEWWKGHNDGKNNLRRLNAEQRVAILQQKLGFDLTVQEKTEYAKSSSFWTICLDTILPIDPVDGLELHRRELLPWQETEYISIQAGIKPNVYDAQSQPLLLKFIKPLDRKRLRTFSEEL